MRRSKARDPPKAEEMPRGSLRFILKSATFLFILLSRVFSSVVERLIHIEKAAGPIPARRTMEDFENKEQLQDSLTEEETLALFKSRGLEPMEEFEPSRPLLYVFEDFYRGDDGPFSKFSRDRRPSFAYIKNPVQLG